MNGPFHHLLRVPPSALPASRRRFLATLAGSAAALPFPLQAGDDFKIVTFTKYFQDLAFEALADAIAETGLAGIEAPVRPGGHIEPAKVEDELPRMVQALQTRNLTLEVMTSGINAINEEQRTEAVLRTAADLGIPRYRMAYYKYDLAKPIRPQLDEIRPRLAELAALNRELGIQAVYQNHSGRDYVGAPVWDIQELVREHDPRFLALAFDIGHATVEGGFSWEIDFNLARPNLGVVYVKDFAWEGRKRVGKPLGEGNFDPKFFRSVAGLQPRVPISLHVEYLPDEPPGPDRTRRHLDAIRRDLATLRQLLDA